MTAETPTPVAEQPQAQTQAHARDAKAPTASAARPSHRPTGSSKLWWALPVAALVAGGVWWYEQRRIERDAASAAQRMQAVETRVDGLRRDVGSHSQRLQQADATNRVLRDELLGISQRAALLEDNVAKLADANRHGVQALRLEEAELLLTLGEQRLQLSADLAGAKRAYALAAGVLDGIDSPGMLNLRQSLAQERAALDALPGDPSTIALQRLDAVAQALPDAASAPAVAANEDPHDAWWERALSRLVSVRRDDQTLAVASEDRQAAQIAMDLELSLARAAALRRDEAGYRAALQRSERWLLRLWPDSPQRRALLSQLTEARNTALRLELPTLGSTLKQLRAQQSPG